MALQTEILSGDVSLNGNLFLNFGKVIVNDPSMIIIKDRPSNDESVPLELNKNVSLDFQELDMDSKRYKTSIETDFAEVANNTSDLTFHYYNEFNDAKVYKGIKMLPIICNNTPRDRPEFVDIDSLTKTILSETNPPIDDCITISDEDEVIFVGEYKGKEKCGQENLQKINKKTEDGIRRNPVRKARNSKVAGDLSSELIFEEDFAFLDDSDDYNMECSKKTPTSYKTWPVNVHERPEYNDITKKVESLDYTIRNTQNHAPNRKPRLETVTVAKKSKKKYFTRKRKPRVPVVEKVPISDLISLVNTTSKMVKDFLTSSDEYRALLSSSSEEDITKSKAILDGKLQLKDNQDTLACIVIGPSVRFKK